MNRAHPEWCADLCPLTDGGEGFAHILTDAAQVEGPGSLVLAALALGKPVHVFAGRVDAVETPGMRLHEITPRGIPLEQALANAGPWLQASAAAAFV